MEEVFEAVERGNNIADYPDDEPYPSCLIYGRTPRNRPIPVVCASSADDDTVIIITVDEPHTIRRVDFQRRVE